MAITQWKLRAMIPDSLSTLGQHTVPMEVDFVDNRYGRGSRKGARKKGGRSVIGGRAGKGFYGNACFKLFLNMFSGTQPKVQFASSNPINYEEADDYEPDYEYVQPDNPTPYNQGGQVQFRSLDYPKDQGINKLKVFSNVNILKIAKPKFQSLLDKIFPPFFKIV